MKKIVLALVLFTGAIAAKAQILNPVRLTYTAKKTKANEYEVRIKATLDPKWHMYSAYNPDAGAGPTVLSFTGSEKVGAVKEVGKMKTVYDKNFRTDQKYFENTVDFVQVVRVKPGATKVEGSIEYIVCNDNKCLPPKEVPFEIKL